MGHIKSLDQYSQSRRPWFRGNRQGYTEPTSEPAEKTENDGQALGTTSSAHSWSRRCQPAQTSSGENSRRKLQNVVADSTARRFGVSLLRSSTGTTSIALIRRSAARHPRRSITIAIPPIADQGSNLASIGDVVRPASNPRHSLPGNLANGLRWLSASTRSDGICLWSS